MDIKIDKVKFDIFLICVRNFIESINENSIPENMIKEKEYILEFINNEEQKRILMEERKLYYNYYIKNKISDPINAAKMYKKYLETNEKLKKLKGGKNE